MIEPISEGSQMIPFYSDPLPALSTPQMIEVDRAMLEDYQISLTQMMENAGRNLAHLARQRFLGGDPRGLKVAVLAGTGGNGGGALACARRLHNYGALVAIFTTKPDDAFAPVPGQQLAILRRMGLPVALAKAVDEIDETSAEVVDETTADLVVDGLIGYSLRGAARGPAADLIRWANRQAAPILALDVPSGLDANDGAVYDPAIRATATMTLALPKVGLLAETAAAHVGELYLADISVPPALYANPGLQLAVGPIFATSDLLRIR
jgi:NAD(P)H-hydrate epimerase